MNKKTIAILAVSISATLSLLGVTTVGSAPQATLTIDPDVDYIGVGMTMEVSITEKEDKDCRDGESLDDTISHQFETTGGSFDNASTDNATLTLPEEVPTGGSITITLKIQDNGTIHPTRDLSQLTVKGTKTVTVGKPMFADQIDYNATTNGGLANMGVVDEDSRKFKVEGIPVLEDLSSMTIKISPSGGGTSGTWPLTLDGRTDVGIGNTDSEGEFDDPLFITLADLNGFINAHYPGASTANMKWEWRHAYSITYLGSTLELSQEFDRVIDYSIYKSSLPVPYLVWQHASGTPTFPQSSVAAN